MEELELDAALERVGGDQGLLRDVAAMFLEQVQELLGGLEQAIEQANPANTAQLAHTLKGAIGNFSSKSAWSLSREIELAARAGDWDTVRSRFQDFRVVLARLVAELREFLANG